MQPEDSIAQTLFWKKLNFVMSESEVSVVNFKGFMTYNTHANWNAEKKKYNIGDPSLLMVGHERTCLFHWSQSLDKITHNYINSLQF
jgi:hypothetical protein